MTNNEIMQVYKGINKIYDSNMKLGVKLSYVLAKDLKVLQPLAEVIEKEQYKLFLKHGNRKEDGNVEVPKENIEALNQDLAQLGEIENKALITKIKLADFDTDVIDFSIITDLMPIIIEE